MSNKEEELEIVEQDSTKEKYTKVTKKRYKQYSMQNAEITSDDLYLYVPENTLKLEERNRFLKLCDKLIIELGSKELTETEIKDIATLYRDIIRRDEMYKVLTVCAGSPDKTTMNDIVNISKQVDTLQKSLKITASSRQEERKNRREMTMMDMLGKFKQEPKLFAMFDKQQQKILDKYENSDHTDVDEYMTLHSALEVVESKKDKSKKKIKVNTP